MKYSKIYDPREMNSYQFVSTTGLIMTLVAHLILILLNKTVENFTTLYLCWSGFFVIGTVVNFYSKPEEDHHHH
ncbi:hypothetical protein ACFSRY_15600 [Pontibacter locisalis]|uniref:Uncharacterized protein n=1 Tax=Pontibacter locisalis TaxID=1719035 RepID=A0ABW5IQM1_9BACT